MQLEEEVDGVDGSSSSSSVVVSMGKLCVVVVMNIRKKPWDKTCLFL